MSSCISVEDLKKHVYVLRLGHRPQRDRRVTTHVALVARAFGARGIYIANVIDKNVKQSVDKVIKRWGGSYFEVIDGVNPFEIIKQYKKEKSCIVHLTMYGLPIDKAITNIIEECEKILVIVGAEKVERVFYELADYNIAIGNQPHSEVSALALFLDRLWQGREMNLCFPDAKYYIVPSAKDKMVKRVER
ncbi:tRNA (cytidine(56)-2'-O)-methyltransferase [Ignisphaera sp. 4213-co]|uniref:tRNA (cytidine(56)-2'-O)-methyltransferase n=1 Tax=Ignisphaera cupida TaxID=3050454 RepID=A0ABD4Z563_9CREN|nr:tRNA (cytidine(56)-2'-O)-methyltransferase [Ignisphaera sp. 4213-co]MDK6027768.1 tRNA (cytidine(56)-2'-O)-methyltransferase [Ignisphaera sp. 4213-co]